MRKLSTKNALLASSAIAASVGDTFTPPAPKLAATTAKPATGKAAKPVAKPAKPDHSAARAERAAVIGAHRATVAKLYSGASLTVHQAKACTLAAYVERINTRNFQQCGPGGASDRDHSLLLLVSDNAGAGGTFDPVALACDAGVISRLASVGFIGLHNGAPAITKAGRERVGLLRSKAKPAKAA